MKVKALEIAFNNAAEAGKPEAVKISYKGGRGLFQIVTKQIFKFNRHEMNVFMGMLDDCPDRETITEQINDYAAFCVGILDRFRKLAKENDKQEEIAEFSAAIKKFCTVSAALADRYNLEAITDEENEIRFKSSDVYDIHKGNVIVKSAGWIFTRHGLTFTVRKRDNGGYAIIVPSCGISAAFVEKRNQIAGTLSAEFVQKIRNIIENGSYAETEKRFSDLMEAAGYGEEYRTRPELAPIHKEEKQEEIQTEEIQEPEAAADPVEEIQPEEKPETNYEPVVYSSAIIDAGYIENLHKEEKPAADPAPEEKPEEIQPEAAADPVEAVQSEKIQAEEKPERIQKKEAPKAQRKKAEPPTFRGIPKKAKYTRVWCYAC